MLNAQKFEIEYSSSNVVAYIIVIMEMDLGELKTRLQVSIIPSEYSDLAHVFSKDAANTLSKYGNHDLCLETTKTPLFGLLYNFFQNELKVFQEYIANNLAKWFIQPSTLFVKVPVLFIKKRDAKLHLCIDYRGLNLITKKIAIYYHWFQKP